MSETPTFENIMAYQRKRRALARQSNTVPVEKVVEEQKAVEQDPDYESMSKSEIYKLAKGKGCELPWVSKTEDLLSYLKNA